MAGALVAAIGRGRAWLSLEPPTVPNLFNLAQIEDGVTHQIGDIRDTDAMMARLRGFKPDIVLHLAAQPIVRLSYEEPVETTPPTSWGRSMCLTRSAGRRRRASPWWLPATSAMKIESIYGRSRKRRERRA